MSNSSRKMCSKSSKKSVICPKTNKLCESSSDSSSRSSASSKCSRTSCNRTSSASSKTSLAATSFFSSTGDGTIIAPSMNIEKGDNKCTFQLSDKGKLVKINKKNGDIIYMLRCVDGRRVYLEKSSIGASLLMTNQQGKIIKTLAAQY